jgi:hypothetical protein
VRLCPSVSTKYRVRGQGALASKVICVRVNGINCGAPAATTGTTTTSTTTVTKRYAKNRIVPLTSIIKPAKNAAVSWKVKGGCAISGKNLATKSKAKTCTLTLTESVKKKVNGKFTTTKKSRTVKIKVS